MTKPLIALDFKYLPIVQSLNTYKWDSIFKNLDINDSCTSRFFSYFNHYIYIFVPKVIKTNSKFPSWYSYYLKYLIIYIKKKGT